MNVLFLNDSTTSSNWGGRAATVPLRMMIRESGGNIVKTVTIDDLVSSSLDGPTAPQAEGGRRARETIKPFIPPVLLTLRRRLMRDVGATRDEPLIPMGWADYEACVERVLREDTPWPELLRSLDDVDVAVIHGDGDISDNWVLPRTLLFLTFLIKKHFDTPVIMVNHSADFSHPDLRRVAEGVYPLFDDVVFRDEISAERCKTMCDGRLAADTAFWFRPAPRETWTPLAERPTYFDVWPDTASFDPAAPYLCIGGSSIIDMATDSDAVVRGYAELLEHLQSLYSGRIVLTASDVVDQPAFRLLAKRYRLPLIGVNAPIQQAVDILGNADAYIGGRWHPGIFALSGGTPVVALSSQTFKMRALADMAGLSSATFDALNLEHETKTIGRQLSSYLEQGAALRNRLRSWAAEMAESSWNNVAYLRTFQTSDGPR